jgi:hypothetical protein
MSCPNQAFVAVLLVLYSPVAPGFDFTMPLVDRESSVEITETLIVDYHDDNFDHDDTNDGYVDIRNRLNLKLAIDEFTLGARIDTSTFIGNPEDASPPYLDRYAPEKLSASYNGKRLQVDLGDFYASFGRGLALRIRKIDELSEDTTLLGVKIRALIGPVELTGLSGLVNPSNTDGITEKTLEDTYDLLTGLRAAWRLSEAVVWGAHGVWLVIDPLRQNARARGEIEMSVLPAQTAVVGTSINMPNLSDRGDFYAEFNWMEKDLKLADLPTSDGWALYAGGSLYLGEWTFTAEFKSYSDYELHSKTESGKYTPERLDYVQPPTLERVDMEVYNNYDITGGRISIDWRPGGGDTLIFASYAGFLAHDLCASCDRWIYNAQVGVEQEFLKRGWAEMDVGIREEVPNYSGGDHKHLVYLNADLKLPLGQRHSLEFDCINWLVHEFQKPLLDKDTLKGELILGYSWSPVFYIGLILGYDTDKSGTRDLDTFFDDGRQLFLAGTASINLSSRLVIKFLAGQLRGGPKCVAGVCRYFPPFAGARIETVVRL